ncbi:hypothetical protein AALO_G00183510 [Alosa alosa]|uniref:Uncharacterized protein n=1 Tax=Alosa alosa TaxID=278164 RepID=A0AAV6GCE7_9TELE|nr:hypothetical protein AALO_G00183510 [Alosa alosa]
MSIFWFLTSCVSARQDTDSTKAIKKKVKKYKLWELYQELLALGVHLDEENYKEEMKSKKKIKRAIQKCLISELMKVQEERAKKKQREGTVGCVLCRHIKDNTDIIQNVPNDQNDTTDEKPSILAKMENTLNVNNIRMDLSTGEGEASKLNMGDERTQPGELEVEKVDKVLRPWTGDGKERTGQEVHF